MKTSYLFLAFLLALMGYPFIANAWFNDSMNYRIPFTVNYTNGTSLSNFPAPINGTGGLRCGSAVSNSLFYGNYPNVNGSYYLYCNDNSDVQLVNSTDNGRLSNAIVGSIGTNYTAATPLYDSNYIGVYSLQEGSALVKDLSPANNNLGYSGSPFYNSSGYFGGSYSGSCYTTNCNYLVNTSATGAAIKENVTLEAWVFFNSLHYTVNSNFILSGGNKRYAIALWVDNTISCWVSDTTTWDKTVHSTFTPTLKTWYYVACTWSDTDGWKLYINGKLDNTLATGGKKLPQSTPDIKILSGLGEVQINGTVDEVRISNITRTADYFNATYQAYAGQFTTMSSQETKPSANCYTETGGFISIPLGCALVLAITEVFIL